MGPNDKSTSQHVEFNDRPTVQETGHNEKSTTEHVDAIGSADTSEHGVEVKHMDANEEIVQHLQTTGEDVGMTWRTIMAAVVSSRIWPLWSHY
jgi:hypothetical protein